MQRRSFFGVLFGGLLARWFPQRTARPGPSPMARWIAQKRLEDEYRFGFSGFKQPEDFQLSPPGFYKPGDTFEIVGSGGRGTGLLRRVREGDLIE